jgi:hypothetical protein
MNLVIFNGPAAILFQFLGLLLSQIHGDAHRFYEGMIHGRAHAHTKRTDGFCLYRTQREGKSDLYVLITYDLLDVSARTIPLWTKQIEQINVEFP